MSKPISPVIVTFKALPGVRLQAFVDHTVSPCHRCRLDYEPACKDDENPKGNCIVADYIWREVPKGEK